MQSSPPPLNAGGLRATQAQNALRRPVRGAPAMRGARPVRGAHQVRSAQGFTLIETMIAVVMVGLMGTGVANLFRENIRQYSETRTRLLISSAAQQTFERVVSIGGTSSLYGGATDFCDSIIATGGPLAGGTVDGSATTCPTDYIVREIPIYGTHLTKTVTMSAVTIGSGTGIELVIQITNPRTNWTAEIRTLIGDI